MYKAKLAIPKGIRLCQLNRRGFKQAASRKLDLLWESVILETEESYPSCHCSFVNSGVFDSWACHSSDLLPIYFGSLGFSYILVFSCMLFLQWRKGIQRERRARAWVQRKKMEWPFHCTLALCPDKETQLGTEIICSSESNSIPQPQGSFLSNEIVRESTSDSFPSLPNADPYKPVFQEIVCASPLAYLPPLLDHSASYPCSSIPAKSTPFNSPLKFAMLKNESYNDGSSSISA